MSVRFLTRRFSRNALIILAAVGLLQVVGFVSYLLGYEAVAVAVVMLTGMLLLAVSLVVLRRVGALAEAVHRDRMKRRPTPKRSVSRNDSSGGLDQKRAEYMVRRLLAAFEQERYQIERRFEELARQGSEKE